ncbi:hypothetical protein ZP9_00010 [Shewanella phage ZP9]|nr:hypothetical protein ZP9_00010 [Shewanella phage ZP9]
MFKNIIAYRFNKPFSIDADSLEAAINDFKFTSCGSQDISKFGFSPAFGKYGKTLVHAAEGYLMVAVTKESKIIPAASIKERLDSLVEFTEHEGCRKLSKKEKDALKDEIITDMLPLALTKKSVTKALILLEQQLILIDSSSASKAEELLALLRKALGSLPVIPLSYKKTVESTLTEWVKSLSAPSPFELQQEAELRGNENEVAKFKNQDLAEDEVLAHIENGMQVHKLVLNFGQSMSFVLCSSGDLKRVRFSEEFSAENDELGNDDPAARLDADFVLFSAEIKQLMNALSDSLGGYESLE